MDYDIHIENLGAIKEADITITPLTILAGENGTGKSFVTKFLYSTLSTINTDVYSNYMLKAFGRINSTFMRVEKYFNAFEDISEVSKPTYDFNLTLKELKDFSYYIHSDESDYFELDDEIILRLKDLYHNYHKELPKLKRYLEISHTEIENKDSSVVFDLPFKTLGGLISPDIMLDRPADLLNELIELLEDPQSSYLKILGEYITDELKENFQVSEIQNLINYSANESLFVIKDLIEIRISREQGLKVKLLFEYLSGFNKINHILFFESPVYWRLLPIIDDLEKLSYRGFKNRVGYEVLTGIPKHFYDLKKLLFTNFKDGERPEFIIECADNLKRYLKGHFKSSDTDLTFENNEGEIIPKNLVSFGMTNIGIIQAVLSKNIINKGSFVFIDEPESNLHPEWQSVLSEVLVNLASNHVNVIITTHSSDMLKAIEVNTERSNISALGSNHLLSTNYFNYNGSLLDLEGRNPIEKIASARAELLKPYNRLSVKKKLFND